MNNFQDKANFIWTVADDILRGAFQQHKYGDVILPFLVLHRFSEMSHETAGEHYTPREVIRLMVNLLFAEHKAELQGKGIIRTIYDSACGTGGMLTIAREHIHKTINPDMELVIYGQELNERMYAIAKSDVLISGDKDNDPDNIMLGSSFRRDQLKGKRFDFMLFNGRRINIV